MLNHKKKQLYKTRQSDVKFFSEQVVYDELLPFVRKANDSANWNYEFIYQVNNIIHKFSKHIICSVFYLIFFLLNWFLLKIKVFYLI